MAISARRRGSWPTGPALCLADADGETGRGPTPLQFCGSGPPISTAGGLGSLLGASVFGLELASEVAGCVAEGFPVRGGLKVGLHPSFMANSVKS